MLNIAIIGTGAISDSHIKAYQQFGDRCRIVALVDLYPDKAKEKAAQYGLDVAVCASISDAVAQVEFDAASICLPPFGHAEGAVELLQAGKHVLVEKPMATCLEECDAMIAAAEASGKLLGVVSQNRFMTPMMKTKAILDSGVIGKVLHAQVDSFWWRGGNYYDLWWRGTWEKEGGGCTMNHAVHHIDIYQWMMGMPAEVMAVTRNLSHENSEVEDFSTAVLTYADGRVGQITASLVHHGEDQQLVFQGEKARIGVPFKVTASNQRENGFPDDNAELAGEIEQRYEELPEVELEGHPGQIDNFLNAIAGAGPLLVDGVEARRTLELVTAIYQSGQLEQKVALPLKPDDLFYTREGILKNARHFHEKTKSVENFSDTEITLGGKYGK